MRRVAVFVGRLVDRAVPPRLGRDFRRLLASSWVTNLGDGITLAAGPLLVASQTRNPLAVAGAGFLQRLPWLLFGLHAGVLADRVDRRRVVIGTAVARLVILLVLIALILTRTVDTGLVLGALFLFGVNETFAVSASTTLVPMLVQARDLGLANARVLTGLIVCNQLVGAPIGAALFAAGTALPFIGECLCVSAGALLVTRLRLPEQPRRDRPVRVREDIRAGRRWLWTHPALRTLAVTIFTFNITYGAAWSVLVLYARQRLGMGEIGFGLLTTASAIGGLAGSACYSLLERHVPLGVIMRAGLIIETLTHLVLALTRWPWLALVVFTVFGAHAVVWGTTSTSIRQRAVPVEFQGRVAGVYLTCMVGGLVAGSGIGGLIADRWGITAPFWFAFGGSTVMLTLIWRSLLQIAHTDTPRTEGSPAPTGDIPTSPRGWPPPHV